MQPSNKARRSTLLGVLLALSLSVIACGGGEDSTAADAGPTAEEDTAAIEKLIVEFGASVGPAACDYYSVDFIRSGFGGLGGCRRETSDSKAVDYELDAARIDGDTGSAIVISPFSDRLLVYPIVREGDSADAYDGWLIDGFYEKEAVAAEEPEEAGEPEEAEEAEPSPEAGGGSPEPVAPPSGESTPYANALGDATEYQTCIEGEGVQGVKNQPFGFGGQPLISFEAGGAVINAVFAPSEGEATKARKAASSGAPIVQVGSALLFTESGAPPESDIGLAYDCAEQVTDG